MDKKTKILLEIRGFVLILLIVSSLRSALADWNDVPTGSMKPTIAEGDRVVINKLAYDLKIPFTTYELLKWGDPKRGDIVVLFSPANEVRLVKRVVGLPGDRVELRNEQLYINDLPLVYSPHSESINDPEQGLSFITDENLTGHVHKVMFTPSLWSARRTFGPVTVPDGQYFVMGDNRDNSEDSRYIGCIDRRRIVGKAKAVAFSLDRTRHYAPRFDRFFTALH